MSVEKTMRERAASGGSAMEIAERWNREKEEGRRKKMRKKGRFRISGDIQRRRG